jgi:hypothetical protein
MGIPLTLRTLKATVWTRTGLSQSELDEAVVDSCIQGALVEFSNVRSKTSYGTMAIQAGVDIYPLPDGIQDLLQFYYANPTIILNDFSFEDILLSSMQGSLANINFGGDIFENPSLTHIWFSKMKEFQDNIAEPTWEVLDGTNEGDGLDKIRLFRVPQSDGLAYYQGSGDWELEEVIASDSETFLKAVLWKVAEARAMKIAVAAEYREYGGIQMVPAFAFWNNKAKQFQDEFYDNVGFYRSPLVVG